MSYHYKRHRDGFSDDSHRYRKRPYERRGDSPSHDARFTSFPATFFEEPLMPYAIFCHRLNLPLDRSMTEYERFQRAHESRVDQTFFEKFADDEWFKEKYHPDRVHLRRERHCREAKLKLTHFQRSSDLVLERWAKVNSSSFSVEEMGTLSPEKIYVLLSSQVPAKLPSQTIKAHFYAISPVPSQVVLSDVFISGNEIFRKVWVIFSTEEDRSKARVAFSALSSATSQEESSLARIPLLEDESSLVGLAKSSPSICHPYFSSPERLSADVDQAFKVVEKACTFCLSLTPPPPSFRSNTYASFQLNGEAELVENSLFARIASEENVSTKLDLALNYLRDVHTFCYYCGVQFDSELHMLRDCGIVHYRPPPSNADELAKEKASDLDGRIALVLMAPSNKGVGSEASENGEKEFLASKKTTEGDGKCRCNATDDCKKLFKSEEFLLKHLKLKHADLLEDFMAKYKRNISFENFRADPAKLTLSLPDTFYPHSRSKNTESFPLLGTPPTTNVHRIPSTTRPILPFQPPLPLHHSFLPPSPYPVPSHVVVGRGRGIPFPQHVKSAQVFHPGVPVCF
jgi:hypothetical protein